MLFTIYGDLKEIHAYKGKTLIAERSANMKNCIFYLSCSLYIELVCLFLLPIYK